MEESLCCVIEDTVQLCEYVGIGWMPVGRLLDISPLEDNDGVMCDGIAGGGC